MKILAIFAALALNNLSSAHTRLAIMPIDGELGDCSTNDGHFNSEEGGCLDFSSGLVWSLGSSRTVSHSQADAYCNDLTEAEFEDWKLPSKEALEEVAADRKASTYFTFTINKSFWTTSKSNSADAWLVNLSTAEPTHNDKEALTGAMVCVRSPSDLDGDHVPDSSDKCNMTPPDSKVWRTDKWKGCAHKDTIISVASVKEQMLEAQKIACKVESDYFKSEGGGCKDLRSGRVWSLSNGVTMGRTDADRYCGGLVQGKQRGWRMPSADELTAISGDELAGKHLNFDTKHLFWTPKTNAVSSASSITQSTTRFRYLVSLDTGKETRFSDWRQEVHANGGGTFVFDQDKFPAGRVVCVR